MWRWCRCKSPFRSKWTYIVAFLRKVWIFVGFHSSPISGKELPITSVSKFLMNLLCRQSQNLCPKNAKPVFTGCCGRIFLSIWAVSFALRVNTMLIFRSGEFPFISVGQKPKNCLFPHLPNFLSLFLCTWKFTFLSDSFTEEPAKGEGQAYLHLTVTRITSIYIMLPVF